MPLNSTWSLHPEPEYPKPVPRPERDPKPQSFNDRLAQKITDAVSTMACAYVFACLALVSLPEAVKGGTATLVAWIAQTFLQLVLLSIIMVGQKLQADSTDHLHDKIDVIHAKVHEAGNE